MQGRPLLIRFFPRVSICAWVTFIVLGLSAGTGWAAASHQAIHFKLELDRAVLPAEGSQKAIVKITLDGAPPPSTTVRPPVNVALVLDRSGSMSGSKLHKAKEATIEALGRLNPRDYFAVVVYDHTIQI